MLQALARHPLAALSMAALTDLRLLGALVERGCCFLFVRRLARRDAARILGAARPGGKLLFVDGGGHLGGGFRFFSAYFPPDRVDFDVFEPNPHCHAALEGALAGFNRSVVRLHPCALSTCGGTVRLFGLAADEGGPLSTGASIKRRQHSIFYDADPAKALAVPAIDFGDYLERNRARYDAIIVKLDVEGAETELLESLLARDLLRCIDTLYVEFHAIFLKSPERRSERRREKRLIRQIEDSGIHFRVWH